MSTHRSKGALIHLGVACLILRAMVPAGYMPGNLLVGEFMVLCPVGMSAGIAQMLHSDHDDHGRGVLDADKTCPIGSALQPAWLPQDVRQASFTMTPAAQSATYRCQSGTADRIRSYQSRAPPLA